MPIEKLLVNLLPQTKQPIPDPENGRYRWVVGDQGLQYDLPNEDVETLPLERACKLMNKLLKQYKDVDSIDSDAKTELANLMSLVTRKTVEYKEKHSGFFGAIYLFFHGLGNGGHIDKVSGLLINNIQHLSNKKTTPDIKNLNVFLNGVAPLAEPVLDRLDRKWVLYLDGGFIADVDASDEGHITDLPVILGKMNEQLNAFSGITEIDALQKKSLEKLQKLILNRAPDLAKEEILAKIQHLLSLYKLDEREPLPLIQRSYVVNELISSEKTFLEGVQAGAAQLVRLKTLTQIGDLQYSRQFKNFYSDGEGSTLDKCIQAFAELEEKTVQLHAMLSQDPSVERLAEVYEGPIFTEYAKALIECIRYNELLIAVDSNLRDKNGENYLQGLGDEPLAKELLSNLTLPYQRITRHVLLTKDMLDKTSPSSPGYERVLSMHVTALSYAAYANETAPYICARG